MKLDNIVLAADINEDNSLGREGCARLQVRAIDFGGATREFSEFVAYTPGYAPNPKDLAINSKNDRILWEFRAFGNTVLELMCKSVFDFMRTNLVQLAQNDSTKDFLTRHTSESRPPASSQYSEQWRKERL
jgi:hypothetical protein